MQSQRSAIYVVGRSARRVRPGRTIFIVSPARIAPGPGRRAVGGDIVRHSRVIAATFAAVLNPLVGIAASLAGALPARGADVPFTERVISTTADGAVSVFATDMDGDGDTDVLSASFNDDKIAWYDNMSVPPPIPAVTEWGSS